MTPGRSTSPPRRPATATVAGPRHDARAWALFFLVGTLLLASVPFAGGAQAQLPEGVPLPLGDDPSDEPTDQPTEDETEDSAGPLPVPAPLPDPTGGGDDDGDDAGAGGQPAAGGGDIKTAYFTSPTSFLVPGQATDDTAQCVVVPETCTPEAQQVTGPLTETIVTGLAEVDSGSEGAAQPVPPGALPVGLLNGQQRYSSAVDIGPPQVAEGNTVDLYTVSFQMSPASFSVESPAFREFVTATISQAGTGGPEQFEAFFNGVASQETALFTQDFPGLQACVIQQPWEAGDNQPSSAEPALDEFGLGCSEAAKPDENGVVTFDLTFPAQEVLLGEASFTGITWDNGILIRPLAAQNLAYGDADYTTNYYAYLESLADNPPQVEQEEVSSPTLPPTEGPGPDDNALTSGGGSSGSSGGSSGSSGGFGGGFGGGSSSSGSSSGSSGSRPSSPSASSASTVTGEPELAPPGAPGGSDSPPLEEPAALDGAEPVSEEGPTSFPIAWILLPMMLGGAFWYGRVLDGAPITEIVRSGAMTRLLQERGFSI